MSKLSLALVLVPALMLPALGVSAQDPHSKTPPRTPPSAQQSPAPPTLPALPGTTAPGKGGPAGQPLPGTAAERTKLLSNLYAYLATAEDEKQAQPIAQAIERLWLFAGSDTIGVLMDRSARAVAEKNLDLAVRFLDAVVDLAPDYAEGWNRRAYVHYLKNDIERMIGDLRRCLALEPNHYRAMDGLAQVLRETGQKKAALKAYERLIEIHPNAAGAQDAIKELSRDVEGQKT